MPLDGKMVVFELDSSLFCSGSSLILFRAKDGLLQQVYDPRRQNVALDSGIDDAIVEYLQQNGIKEVYSPREIRNMPESVLGLKLSFDSEQEYCLYRPLEKHCWEEFLAEAGIMLKEFDPRTLEELS